MKARFSIFLLAAVLALPFPLRSQERLCRLSDPSFDAPAHIRDASLYGKSIVFFGDSYIQNHVRPIEETWHYKLAVKYNMEYHNFGWNGNCVAYDRTAENFGPAMYERYKVLPEKADYVVVCAGHNDASRMMYTGEGTDAFREKLKVLCEALVRKYPGAKLCFVTPWAVPRPMFPSCWRSAAPTASRSSTPPGTAVSMCGTRSSANCISRVPTIRRTSMRPGTTSSCPRWSTSCWACRAMINAKID